MIWVDIAGIVFTCVTMNHLGLIAAVEENMGNELPVINCPKCSSFWMVFAYMLISTQEVITSLAISFLASYSALWLELLEAYIDTFYMSYYEKIYNPAADTPASDAEDGDTEGPVS